MPTFVSYVSDTQDAVKGMLSKPSDRSVGIKGLVESVGGKLIIASGAIAKVETVRAWTMPEYKEIMEKGGRVAAGFKPPGT
jgi:hypothetical protein